MTNLRPAMFAAAAAALLLLSASAGAQSAPAAPAALNADLMTLHAHNGKGGIDGKIGKLPQLKKPPFSQFKSWKLLEKSKATLAKDVIAAVRLPNGNVVELNFKAVVMPQKVGDPVKYTVTTLVKKSDGSTMPVGSVTTKAGEVFFVSAGQHLMGVIMVAIKVSP
ncbi:MAG: hypothetical protein IT370_07125 [Deltaproteobacteria bacterium]|nr:hypothetical protein [Deltaproteobacteria bacterium]